MKFTSALTILFIGLKLTGHIDWWWVFVLMPLIPSMIQVIIDDVKKENGDD